MDKISTIQNLCTNESIRLTKHAANMMEEHGITFSDVKCGIKSGEIIEDYLTDYPNPSVLILGNIDITPIHVCVGIGKNNIQIITAYKPSLDIWEDDLKTRKVVKP